MLHVLHRCASTFWICLPIIKDQPRLGVLVIGALPALYFHFAPIHSTCIDRESASDEVQLTNHSLDLVPGSVDAQTKFTAGLILVAWDICSGNRRQNFRAKTWVCDWSDNSCVCSSFNICVLDNRCPQNHLLLLRRAKLQEKEKASLQPVLKWGRRRPVWDRGCCQRLLQSYGTSKVQDLSWRWKWTRRSAQYSFYDAVETMPNVSTILCARGGPNENTDLWPHFPWKLP